jgi:hypothetical protein
MSVGDLTSALAPVRGIRDVMKSSGEIDVAHAYTDPRRQAPTIVMESSTSRRAVLLGAIGLVTLAAVGTGLIIASRAKRSEDVPRTEEATAAAPVASATPPVESAPPPPPATAADVSPSAEPSVAPSAAPSAKPRAAPAKARPAVVPHKPGGPAPNDRRMFGERK